MALTTRRFTIAAVTLFASLSASLSAPLASAASLDQLQWLQGCWAAEGAQAGSVEQWMGPAGGSMLGASRTVKGGKTVAFEFMQMRESEPGKIVFIAQPSGVAPTTFALLREADGEFVFENAAHDFPQRVIYKRDGAMLRARIEGMVKGKPKAIDFPMQRIGCDPA